MVSFLVPSTLIKVGCEKASGCCLFKNQRRKVRKISWVAYWLMWPIIKPKGFLHERCLNSFQENDLQFRSLRSAMVFALYEWCRRLLSANGAIGTECAWRVPKQKEFTELRNTFMPDYERGSYFQLIMGWKHKPANKFGGTKQPEVHETNACRSVTKGRKECLDNH